MNVFLHRFGNQLRRVPLEAVIWTAGLAVLACTNPEAEGLIEGCLSKLFLDTPCPGCGLGHAVAYLFRGDLVQSFQAHPLGPFAVAILAGHVIRLVWEAFARPLSPLEPL
ncbi:MAG: DUF2752 domain-containing protein [Rhodothermales bacterium]